MKLFILFCVCSFATVVAETPERRLKNLELQVLNQDQEVAMLKNRLESIDASFEDMQKELGEAIKKTKETQKKVSDQKTDKNIEKLCQDMQTFKNKTNELSQALIDLEKNAKQKDEIIGLQAQELKELQNALQLIANAIDVKESVLSTNSYEVKPGDTLEKIAKAHHTTIQSIKEQNHMQKDVIYPGQKLVIK